MFNNKVLKLYLVENAKHQLLRTISQTYYQDINNTKFLMTNK